MGEGESSSIKSSSLELLSNTAAWKNAVEKKGMMMRVSSPPTTGGGTPTEVLIISPQNQPGSLSASNFARSTSTLSLAGQGGGDQSSSASSVVATTNHNNNNVETTASSVSSFDGDSAYSNSPKTCTGVGASTTGLSLESASVPNPLPTDAAAAYRAAMMGILSSASTSPQQQQRFSSTIGEQPLSLSLPMLGSNTAATVSANMTTGAAVPAATTAFLLEQKSRMYSNLAVPQGGSSMNSNAIHNSTASLLSEANLILTANMLSSNTNGTTPAPSPQAMSSISKTMQENKQAEPTTLLTSMAQENKLLKQNLSAKDKEILKLRKEMSDLQTQIQELRQLPTGKISQIPVEDMIEMMQTYGSEVSDSVMPIRKNHIQKASIVRQFRRWNPNFLEHFHHVNGKWVPKLGRDGELKRRRQARLERKSTSSTTTTNTNISMTGAATSAAALSSKSSTKAAATTSTVFPSANKVTRKKAKKGLA